MLCSCPPSLWKGCGLLCSLPTSPGINSKLRLKYQPDAATQTLLWRSPRVLSTPAASPSLILLISSPLSPLQPLTATLLSSGFHLACHLSNLQSPWSESPLHSSPSHLSLRPGKEKPGICRGGKGRSMDTRKPKHFPKEETTCERSISSHAT